MKTISFYHLSFTLLPLLVVWVYYYKWTKDIKEIPYSLIRMVTQLLMIGFFLIYLFETKNLYLGMTVILFMALVSSWITLRNTQIKTLAHYWHIFSAISFSAIVHLLIIIILVLQIDYFYEPRYVIPIAGMIFANTMNAISLCIERFEKELAREEFTQARKIAFKASMIPQINTLLAVGLVAIPGMMTGQILSGIDPLIAVRYQIMIMAMTLSTAGLSVIVYFYLRKKS